MSKETRIKHRNVCQNITEQWFMHGRYFNTPKYVATFIHKKVTYHIGSFDELSVARKALDKKRIQLGLEPLYLKRVKN